jgi:hypothetical protein
MRGNSHVRFLGGNGGATRPTQPTQFLRDKAIDEAVDREEYNRQQELKYAAIEARAKEAEVRIKEAELENLAKDQTIAELQRQLDALKG